MEQKKRKNDVILIIVLLVAALLAYGGIRIFAEINTKKAEVVVLVSGQEYGRYPLDENHTEHLEHGDGSYNVLEIKDGKADITEASCPDKICVNHRPINRTDQTIVCLPNEVVIEIENGEESEVDFVTN